MSRKNLRLRANCIKVYTERYLLALCCVIYSFIGNAQTEERNQYILTKNSFSVGVANGFNKTQFSATNGEDLPQSGLGWIPKLDFDYRFSLGDHFGINLGVGAGFMPFSFKVDPKDPFQGTEGYSYFQLAQYHPYGSIKTSLDYNYWFTTRWGFMTKAGAGFWNISQLWNTVSGEGDSGVEYLFDLNFKDDLNPFVYFTAGVNHILKNDNILNLSLSYEHVNNNVYEGDYFLYNGQSKGTFINKGNNVSISLAYLFTRAKKFKAIDDFYLESGEIGKIEDAQKEVKVDRRFIDQNTLFFGLSSGLYYARNETGLGDHFVAAGGAPAWIVAAEMEKGMSGNQFMQFGLDIAQSNSYLRVNNDVVDGVNISSEFVGAQISAGIGTHLIGKTNKINYLNLSAGLSIGINATKLGNTGYATAVYTTPVEMDTIFKHEILYSVKSNFYPTVYLNLSRDFQLSRAFYLSIDYRFNYGFVTTVRGDVTYQEQPDFEPVKTDRINMKGTANSFQIGLKYKFQSKNN